MTEIGYAVAICYFCWKRLGEDDAVDGGDEEIVRPVREEITYVYDWGRVEISYVF